MRNLIRCHFSYLFNKPTIIVFLIIIVISLFGNIFSITSLNPRANYLENNQYYFYNSFHILKLVSTFLAIFIFSYSFIVKSDQYAFLIITRNISRLKYFFSKLITLVIILGVFCWIEYFIYLIVGSLGYHQFFYSKLYLLGFINLYILNIFYGLFSLFLIQLFNNIYTVIIPFSILNLGTIINESNKNFFSNLYNIFFPNFINGSIYFVFNYLYIFVIMIVFIFINSIIYQRKDLG